MINENVQYCYYTALSKIEEDMGNEMEMYMIMIILN